jgi:hypothetical protein
MKKTGYEEKDILVDGEGLEKEGLYSGMVGEVTGRVTLEGKKYVFFRPKGGLTNYAIAANRVEEPA